MKRASSKKKQVKYYVSYYSEYPIFEPAEGGCFYAGARLISSVASCSLKKARRVLAKMVNSDWNDPVEPLVFQNLNRAAYHSRYIGEGSFLVIETVKGRHTQGYQVYC